jgi:hypothetical protein
VKQIRATKAAGKTTMIGKLVQPYIELVSTKANFHRLAIGCLVMFYQQFIGCNVSRVPDVSEPLQGNAEGLLFGQAIIYYAPTSKSDFESPTRCRSNLVDPLVFAQLGLDPNTTSLLATGVYGITNTVRADTTIEVGCNR